MTKPSKSLIPDRQCSLCGSNLHSLAEHDASGRHNALDIADRYQHHVVSPIRAPSIASPELPLGAPFSEGRR
jgi:predicted DCC family thiol-disulfide oxidoreductase YuxK